VTKAEIVSFARAQAFQDVRFERTSTVAELERAINGYAACRATLGLDNGAVHPASVQSAIDIYQKDRGVLFLVRKTNPTLFKEIAAAPTIQREKIATVTPLRLRLRKNVRVSDGLARGWCGPLTAVQATATQSHAA
jgi:hypothetical protein